MSKATITNTAALTAVITAFVVGIIGSLAVRPVGGGAQAIAGAEGEVARRVSWRLPVPLQTTMPGIGEILFTSPT